MSNINSAFSAAPRASGAVGFQPAAESQSLHCSFCELGEGEVARLFEGRAGYICNECVEVCGQLLADYRELGYKPPAIKVPWYKRLFGGESAKPGHCSFCGAAQGGDEWLLASSRTQICEKCIRACEEIKSHQAVGA
jgi:hypothetical protein